MLKTKKPFELPGDKKPETSKKQMNPRMAAIQKRLQNGAPKAPEGK